MRDFKRDNRIIGGIARSVAAIGVVFAATAASPEARAQSFSFGATTPEGLSFSIGTGGGGWQTAPLWMVPAAAPAVIAAPVYYGESPKHYRKRVKKMRKAMRHSAGAWGAVELPGGIVLNVGAPIDVDDDWYDDDDWDAPPRHHSKKFYKKLRKKQKEYYKKRFKKHHKKHHHHDWDDDDDDD